MKAAAEAVGCESIGRGAFRTAWKPRREARWSVLKGKCRHE